MAEKKNGMPVWAERAQSIMTKRGMTYDDVASALEVKSRSAVGHYLAGRRQLSADQAVHLAECLGCRVAWLLTGELPIEKPEGEGAVELSPQALLDRFGDLPPHIRSAISGLIESLATVTVQRPSQRGKTSPSARRKR